MSRKQDWDVKSSKSNVPTATSRIVRPWSKGENVIKNTTDAQAIGRRMAIKVSRKLKLRLDFK